MTSESREDSSMPMSELPDRETFPEERALADLLAERGRALRRIAGRYSISWPETRRAVTRPAWAWPYSVALGVVLVALAVWFVSAN